MGTRRAQAQVTCDEEPLLRHEFTPMLQKAQLSFDSDLQQVWPRLVGLAELLAAEEDREGAEDVTLWQGLLRPRMARLLPAVRLIHVVPTRRARRGQLDEGANN